MCSVIGGELYLRFTAECSSTHQGLLVMTTIFTLGSQTCSAHSPFFKVIIFLSSVSCTGGESCIAILWTKFPYL